MKYILASSSPRRKKLLSMFDLDLECVEHSFDESSVTLNNSPEKYCQDISRGKAISISGLHRNSTIISADTIVFLDDTILEKPNSNSEAIHMLQLLSGRKHSVITSVTIMCQVKKINFSFEEKTMVQFDEIDIEMIEYYVEKYQPLDKSGSYGIQDFSSIFVKSIDGCFFNVVGLPLTSLFFHLKRLKLIRFSLNTKNRINKL